MNDHLETSATAQLHLDNYHKRNQAKHTKLPTTSLPMQPASYAGPGTGSGPLSLARKTTRVATYITARSSHGLDGEADGAKRQKQDHEGKNDRDPF